jgi:tetratricopeptide (TPR) repeat protein
LGYVFVTCGSLLLALGLIIGAGVAAAILNYESGGDGPGEILSMMGCCASVFIIGPGLLLFGISKLRSQKKKPAANEFGGYRTNAEKAAWSQAMVGVEFLIEGRYRDALVISEQALDKNPKCKEAWVVKGGALTSLNRFQEALTCYEQALAIDPGYEEATIQKELVLQYLVDAENTLSGRDR